MKICSFCNIEKEDDEFYSRDGHCKPCRRAKMKEYGIRNKDKKLLAKKEQYNKNKEEILAKQREYYHKNIEEIRKSRKEYRDNNKEKIKQQNAKYREQNKEAIKKRKMERHKKIKNKKCNICGIVGDYTKFNIGQGKCKECQMSYLKEYHGNNRKELNKKAHKRQRERLKRDPKYKLDRNVSKAIWDVLRGNKNGRKWEFLVGYTLDDLKKHLESKFDSKMTWENYGEYWEVDHIIPKSYFKYKIPEDEEFKLCWCLNNLQPLSKERNRYKNAKFIG